MTNLGFHRLMAERGVRVVTTDVGDRYVLEALRREGGVLGGEQAVRRVAVRVPAEKLDCGNGTMNEHMLKALRAKEFKTIAFRVAAYEVAKGADGVKGTLTGTLTLGEPA